LFIITLFYVDLIRFFYSPYFIAFPVLCQKQKHLAKRPTYNEIVVLVLELQQEIKLLKEENKLLKEEIHFLKHKKNSNNSSIPPSKDENRPKRTNSLRQATGKKPGGQPGHKGKTLEMTATPDEIVEIKPKYCQCCGGPLDNITGQKEESRQVLDIPPIKAIFTEYQVFSKKCKCGHTTIPCFPNGVNSPVSYGPNIAGLIGYFYARQYMPFARMQEMFNNIFNINISEGGIHYLLDRFADKINPVYETIRERIQNSKVIGTDETGAKVNGKKHWFWTWQTQKLTYIAHSENRGMDTINANFPLGFPNSTLVSDAWKAQLNTTARFHQCCLSHLQRNTKYLNELYEGNKWGNEFLKLLYESLELKQNMVLADYYRQNHERDKIMERFDQLLLEPPDQKNKELYKFYNRIERDRKHIFTFLFIAEVPPDNNASERAIRNIKVKQKISGQFKINKAAQNFAKIRSVIDTTIKNGLNVLDGLYLISKFDLQFN
jgi:transposase